MAHTSAIEVWERHVRSAPQRCRVPVVSIVGDGNIQAMLSSAGLTSSPSTSHSPTGGEEGTSVDHSVSGTLGPIGVQYGSYVAMQPSTVGVDGNSYGAGDALSAIIAISVASGGVCIVAPTVDDMGFPQRHYLLEQLAEGVRFAKVCHPLIEVSVSSHSTTMMNNNAGNGGGFSAAAVAIAVPTSSLATCDISSWLFKAEPTYISETAERDFDAVERNGFRMAIRAAVGMPDVINISGLSDFIKRAVVSKPRGLNRPLGWDVTCTRLRQLFKECACIQQSLTDVQITQSRQYLKALVDEEFYGVCRVKAQKGSLPSEALYSLHAIVVAKINARVNFLVCEGVISETDSLFTSLSTEAISLMASGLEKYGAIQQTYKTHHLVSDAVSRGAPSPSTNHLNHATTAADRLRMVRARLSIAKQQTSQCFEGYRMMVDTYVPRRYRFWLSGHGVLIVLGIALFILTSLWTGRGER